jgi:hypothetical protein
VRTTPVAPGIHAHSIIPTLQDGPLEDRDDGVVAYRSAHIDGVESELVIEHQGHSTQSNPLAVREVRRILVEELGRPERARGETPSSRRLTRLQDLLLTIQSVQVEHESHLKRLLRPTRSIRVQHHR